MKPVFQMPFMCNQEWRASTANPGDPDNSIVLVLPSGATAGQPVFASAGGTVVSVHEDTVCIKHTGAWFTWYEGLDGQIAVAVGQAVVRGQRLGRIASTAVPRLRYWQQDPAGDDVRITFDNQEIIVHAGTPQLVQRIVSRNCPAGIVVKKITGGATATCTEGAGLRATVTGQNTYTDVETTSHGAWVGAKAASTAKLLPGNIIVEEGSEIFPHA